MSAIYPLEYRDGWTRATITHAVAELAISCGFDDFRQIDGLHESDADDTIADMIRHCGITDESARHRLFAQKSLLSEEYLRWECHWSGTHGEIVLVLAAANTIPFPSPQVKISGELWFACGFIDFAISDRIIADLRIDSAVQRLPLLFNEDRTSRST